MKKMPGKMIRWYGMAPTFSSGERIHLSISSTLKYSFSMPGMVTTAHLSVQENLGTLQRQTVPRARALCPILLYLVVLALEVQGECKTTGIPLDREYVHVFKAHNDLQ